MPKDWYDVNEYIILYFLGRAIHLQSCELLITCPQFACCDHGNIRNTLGGIHTKLLPLTDEL